MLTDDFREKLQALIDESYEDSDCLADLPDDAYSLVEEYDNEDY